MARGQTLDIVSQAETLEPFRPLHENLELASLAYYVAELIAGFTEERDENAPVPSGRNQRLSWLEPA